MSSSNLTLQLAETKFFMMRTLLRKPNREGCPPNLTGKSSILTYHLLVWQPLFARNLRYSLIRRVINCRAVKATVDSRVFVHNSTHQYSSSIQIQSIRWTFCRKGFNCSLHNRIYCEPYQFEHKRVTPLLTHKNWRPVKFMSVGC